MKTFKCSLFVALVVGLGLSTVMLLTISPRTQTTDANEATAAIERSQDADRNEPVIEQPASAAPIAARRLASVAPPTPAKTDASAADLAPQPVTMMQVRADQVLAKVNDQAIVLKHLVPLEPYEQEQAMTLEEYESRLNRAIEMELTFQAAAARAVELTPAQWKRVDGVARRHEATLREYGNQGFTWTTLTAAQVEFEQRLTSALMLQQNLVAMEAHVAPASDPSVQARYEQARSEILSRIQAQANISVSTTEL